MIFLSCHAIPNAREVLSILHAADTHIYTGSHNDIIKVLHNCKGQIIQICVDQEFISSQSMASNRQHERDARDASLTTAGESVDKLETIDFSRNVSLIKMEFLAMYIDHKKQIAVRSAGLQRCDYICLLYLIQALITHLLVVLFFSVILSVSRKKKKKGMLLYCFNA